MQAKIADLISKWQPRPAFDQARERLRASPLAHRLAKGAFWSLVGAASSRLLTVVASVIMVRILGKLTVGEYGIVTSTLAMLGTFAGLGLGMTATKYTAELRGKDPARTGQILGLVIAIGCVSGLVMTIAGWAASDWLADRAMAQPALSPYLRASAIAVLIGVIDGVLSSALAGLEAFAVIARINIYTALFNVAVTLPLVYWFGLYGAVAAFVLPVAMHMLLSGIALLRECRSHSIPIGIGRPTSDDWTMMIHYALPALAAGVLVMPVTWLANVILVRTPEGVASMGALNPVNTLRNVVMYLPMMLLAPTFSVLANVAANAESVRKTLSYAIGLSALAVLPLALVVTGIAKPLLGTLWGPDFAGEGTTLAFAMVVVAVQATGMALGSYIQAIGRMWLGLLINLLWAVAFLGLSYLWIPQFGSAGYMAAMALAYVVNVVMVYAYLWINSPHLMRCYPLSGVLILFGLMMPVAMYVNEQFDLPVAGGISLLMGAALAGILVLPLVRQGRVTLAPIGNEASPTVAGGED